MTKLAIAQPAHHPWGQLFRYGVVGVVQNAAGYLLYLLVTWLGVPPKLALTVLYAAGATASFFGNRKFTFRHEGAVLSSGPRFVLAHVAGYLITLLIQLVVTDRLGYPHQLAQGVAIFVVAGFLFVTFRYFVFPNGRSHA